MGVYCTLYNSNYLDKGIVMIQSLQKADPSMKMYVLCMDDLCFDIMEKLSLEETVLIPITELMDSDLRKLKEERSVGEFCWTCTAMLIEYVILHFHELMCTYVDADLCFYSNPSCLIQEMREAGCTVQIISHRFEDNVEGRRKAKDFGRNCVQFNTFMNEERSMSLLHNWIEQCFADCSGVHMGDQMYTDDWGDLEFVNVSENGGAGMAPWNIHRYKRASDPNMVYDRIDHCTYAKVFYHFAQVFYIDRCHVYIMPPKLHWSADCKLIRNLYAEYLQNLEQIKCLLEKEYNFLPLTITPPYQNTQSSAEKGSIADKFKNKGARGILRALDNRIRYALRTKYCEFTIHSDK